jgi:hypothetical protein
VTSDRVGGASDTDVRCRRRPGRKACPGFILAADDEAAGTIWWMCPECGDNGLITGWVGTQWDGRASRSPGERERVELRLVGGSSRDVPRVMDDADVEPEPLVNRSAAVVTPREPFVRWATSMEDGNTYEDEVRGNVSVYLVPHDPHGDEEAASINQWYARVFELELEGWCTNDRLWPQKRDLATFLRWFEVATQSVVTDLGVGPIGHDDW